MRCWVFEQAVTLENKNVSVSMLSKIAYTFIEMGFEIYWLVVVGLNICTVTWSWNHLISQKSEINSIFWIM